MLKICAPIIAQLTADQSHAMKISQCSSPKKDLSLWVTQRPQTKPYQQQQPPLPQQLLRPLLQQQLQPQPQQQLFLWTGSHSRWSCNEEQI